MTIYIAGAISSRMETYKAAFNAAEDRLKADGHIVWNPAYNPVGLEYGAYFPVCFAMIDTCDAVYMLDGWQLSKGATRERAYALANSKRVIYENPTPMQAAREKGGING